MSVVELRSEKVHINLSMVFWGITSSAFGLSLEKESLRILLLASITNPFTHLNHSKLDYVSSRVEEWEGAHQSINGILRYFMVLLGCLHPMLYQLISCWWGLSCFFVSMKCEALSSMSMVDCSFKYGEWGPQVIIIVDEAERAWRIGHNPRL